MRIGKNVMIAFGTTIMDYDGHPIFQTKEEEEQERDTYGGTAKPITIEDNVWIGFKSTILKGVTIGAGSIVGAYSCVTKDVPPNCMVAGNPARIIKENISWRRY
jgi:acetyltransferase-like isoleucine patch superfamily enzyme